MTRAPQLESLLKEVARSFYLTLRILPRPVRWQVGLAYLLARATDTVADTSAVPVEDRLEKLRAMGERISGNSSEPIVFDRFCPDTPDRTAASAAEQSALKHFDQFVGTLGEFSETDRALIRHVLQIIISGQELDLRRFAGAGPNKIVALQTDEELDDYTYRVAGCVGEFWTRITRAHLFPTDSIDEAAFLQNGIRFGKGLQLVNILRDIPADLSQGRCYLPKDRLTRAGLEPADLLHTAAYERFRPIHLDLLSVAKSHLQAGWVYTDTVPWRLFRLRLACAWPILIGVATIRNLQTENVLDRERRVKVSRSEVRKIVFCSIMGHFLPPIWERLFPRTKLV